MSTIGEFGITQNQWIDALREWEDQDSRETLYSSAKSPVSICVCKDFDRVTLVAKPADQADQPAVEKLSITTCIELTQKFFSSYETPKEFQDIGRIWEQMQQNNLLSSEQIASIHTIIEDAKAMAATLQLSLQTAQRDNTQDTVREFLRIANIFSQTARPQFSELSADDDDLYTENLPNIKHIQLNKTPSSGDLRNSSHSEEELNDDDLYRPLSEWTLSKLLNKSQPNDNLYNSITSDEELNDDDLYGS